LHKHIISGSLIEGPRLHIFLCSPTAWLRTLVGFSPRMNAYDPRTDSDRYLRWQHTWWNGVYSIILTKACFLHRRYLDEFFKVLPAKLIEEMDKNRNCEDIAMAYVVAVQVSASPSLCLRLSLLLSDSLSVSRMTVSGSPCLGQGDCLRGGRLRHQHRPIALLGSVPSLAHLLPSPAAHP
jgi:hypothetical protein